MNYKLTRDIILKRLQKFRFAWASKLMKGSIFQIVLELIKMAITWHLSGIFSAMFLLLAIPLSILTNFWCPWQDGGTDTKVYTFFFALLCFEQSFVLSIENIDIILFIYNWPKKYIFITKSIVFSILFFYCFAHEHMKKHPQKQDIYF